MSDERLTWSAHTSLGVIRFGTMDEAVVAMGWGRSSSPWRAYGRSGTTEDRPGGG